MNARLLIPLALAALLPASASAQDSLVAGWDFSQYFDTGALSIDGATFTDVLSANYSDLDPTFGAGAESADFGTMYINGDFGSSAVPIGSGNEQFVPSGAAGGSLVSNLDAPTTVDFDSFSVLTDEGQEFANPLTMIASASVSVVFEADLSGVPESGSNWLLSFGARAFEGTSSIGVEFSTDGMSYAPVGTADLTTVDTLYLLALGAASSELAYVRLTFAPSGTNQPLIDNLAIVADLSGGPTPTPTPSPTPTPTASGSPIPTPTPTGSPVPTPTPTPTGSPVLTPTPTATATPTATPTATATPTVTATPTPRIDLTGRYPFVDKVKLQLDTDNQTFSNVDTASDRFCLAGLVRGIDARPSANREVRFEYRSQGTIQKANLKRVKARFPVVDLTLTIEELGSELFSETIVCDGKLDARLRKSGETQSVRLRCDVGPDLSFFHLPAELVDSVSNAFPKQGHIKLDVPKGRLRLTHKGEPASAGTVDLSCDF